MNRQTEARMAQQTFRTGGRMIGSGIRTHSGMIPSGIRAHASETERPDLYKPIRVKPEDSQTLQWLVPGNTIEYQIITNFDWQII